MQQQQQHQNSLAVFRDFIDTRADGTLDASRVLSTDCFEAWQKSRRRAPSNAYKSFQRTLSAHITGIDNRTPFSPAEEQAVLVEMRKKSRWPCFAHMPNKFKMGEMGFRAKGFHEKTATSNAEEEKEEDANAFSSMLLPMSIGAERFRTLTQMAIANFPGGANSRIMERVFGIGRMLLVSAGVFTRPSREDAIALLHRMQEERPDPSLYFLIMDCTTRTYADRFIYQSENTRRLVGDISRETGGTNAQMVQWEDVWSVVASVASAFGAPGKFQPPLTCCFRGKQGEELKCTVEMILDPHLALMGFVMRGSKTPPQPHVEPAAVPITLNQALEEDDFALLLDE